MKELASSHPSSAYNFEVAPRFVENSRTPAQHHFKNAFRSDKVCTSYVRDACRNVLTSTRKTVNIADYLNTISTGLTLLINFSSALFQAAVAHLVKALS